MAEFVSINEDKFEKKTTYETTKKLLFGANFISWRLDLKLRRVVVMPDTDFMLIDIYSHGLNNSKYLNIDEGKLIILADDETITLPANSSYYDHDGYGNAEESCYYELGKENLLKICNCNSISMKFYTKNESEEVSNANAFAVYCKLFYNAVYDNSAYTDVVANALGEFTGLMADTSKFDDVKLDGSGANGCMGVLALMVTVAGAAIGGICAIV